MAERAPLWSDQDLELIRQHLDDLPLLYTLFPLRSKAAVRNKRDYYRVARELQPAVKAPGDYVEHLSVYLVDDWECLVIWLKWNGYTHHRELSRDRIGWVTLLCTAK